MKQNRKRQAGAKADSSTQDEATHSNTIAGGSGMYWMLLAKTNPATINVQLPIFWNKRVALDYLKKIGGTLVRVDITW